MFGYTFYLRYFAQVRRLALRTLVIEKIRNEKESLPKMSEIDRRLLDALLDGDGPILAPLRIHCLIHPIPRP